MDAIPISRIGAQIFPSSAIKIFSDLISPSEIIIVPNKSQVCLINMDAVRIQLEKPSTCMGFLCRKWENLNFFFPSSRRAGGGGNGVSPFQQTNINLCERWEGGRHLGHHFLCAFPKLCRHLWHRGVKASFKIKLIQQNFIYWRWKHPLVLFKKKSSHQTFTHRVIYNSVYLPLGDVHPYEQIRVKMWDFLNLI